LQFVAAGAFAAAVITLNAVSAEWSEATTKGTPSIGLHAIGGQLQPSQCVLYIPAMLSLVTALFVAWMSAGSAAWGAPQAAPPSTDVFLAELSIKDGKITVGKPENISNSPGYDNQPFFTPDGRAVLFTSDRASSQMEIYTYDLAARGISRLTNTPESEYSPTVTPDGRHLSVIRVEADGTQRLWKFTSDGQNPSLVLTDVKPVGYHAWLDDSTLVLFVLGQQGQPATLQVANIGSGQAQIVTRNIGQSIAKIPGGGVSFVQQAGEGDARTLTITKVNTQGGKVVTTPLTPAVAGARQAHVAWTPDGTLLMAHDGTLHAWKQGESGWRAVADLDALGLRNVTRLAVSPKGDRLAIVAVPSAEPTDGRW
jgi:hypothetical protein